jgi:hypothetical protein
MTNPSSGWDDGLSQDYNRDLGRWFADRPGARYQLRLMFEKESDMKPYQPRRASAKWQEKAPEFVIDCFDNKGKTCDRYTVLIGGSHYSRDMGRNVYFLGMSDAPTHPQGFSQWGECPATWRPARGRVRWLDLPEHIRKHVVARATAT